jgi:hypothetical protein
MDEIQLDKNTGNTVLIMGSSKAGKSTYMMRIYDKYFKNKHEMIKTLFCTSSQLDMYHRDEELLICEEFPKEANFYIKDQLNLNRATGNTYEFLNMFDDILDMRFNKMIIEMVLTLRNSKISTIIAIQDPKLVNKSARGSMNNCVFFRFNTDQGVEDCLNTFLKSSFRKLGIQKDDMINVYRDLTSNHNYLYLNNITGYLYSSKQNKVLIPATT